MTVMREPRLRLQLLGRFEVHDGDRVVPIGGPTAQAVFIALLDRPGQTKQASQVIAAVWGRPDTVTDDSLYHYVSKLRKVLLPLGIRIESCWPGYRLVLPERTVVDAVRFVELVRTARSLRSGEPEQATQYLRAALDLWQGGSALAGLTLPGTRATAARLDEQRLHAAELLAELELAAGRPDEVLARLQPLAVPYVDRGGLVAAVMRALHATGRGAEALSLYRKAERVAAMQGRRLADAVQRARHEVLNGEPAQPVTYAPAAPYQLPADTSHFTGRTAELAQLRALWPANGAVPTTLVVSALDGMAGIGKTALAVHAAHDLAPTFRDGNLFLDLHGFTPKTRPTPPQKALDTLLRGLGVPGQQIPPDPDARAAMYRSRLARRRMLIVLDNAFDEAQVRPLLPGTTSCLVIVTSRRRLSGLDDAAHLTLDTLPPGDAAELFRRVASDRAAGDHQVINQIVGTCGGLPLAIRIAAARLRTSRAMSPVALLSSLRRGRDEPELAGLDDGARSIAAAFEVSYKHLAAEQQHAFRLLAVHPGPTFDGYAAAAMLDTDLDQARLLLGVLEQVNLLIQPAPGRYGFHDLLRKYATDDPVDPDPRRALGRLLDHYGYATARAVDAVYPYEARYRPRVPAPAGPTPPLAGDRVRAAGWLHEELPNLLAAATQAAARHPGYVLCLSALLARHLRTQVRYADGHALHTQALEIARERGDDFAEMTALIALGRVEQATGQHAAATDHHRQALAIARSIDHPHGQLGALNGLGHVARLTSTDEHAIDYYRQAIQVARQHAHPIGQIDAFWGLGKVRSRAGLHHQASQDYRTALALAQRIGHHGGQIRALTGLGHIHLSLGDVPKATAQVTRALEIAVRVGDLCGEVYALCGLGDAARQLGRHPDATEHYQAALARSRDITDRNGEYEALQGLGNAGCAAGQPEPALSYHEQALDLAQALGQPHDQARAHDGLARAYRDLGHTDRARTHWTRAVDILSRLDAPGADLLRGYLAALTA
jgi:tetratricopeptide (TPR) repeat protein